MMISCPVCHSLSTVPIAYGKPSHEMCMAASRGLVELAGCTTGDHDPSQRCLDCRHAWRCKDLSESNAAAQYVLKEIAQIVHSNLFSIYAGMASATLFSEGAADFEPMRDYIRLKNLLEIRHGCSSEQVGAVEKFCINSPDSFNRITEELARQVCVLSLTKEWPGGLYQTIFTAAALIFNASPMSNGNDDSRQIEDFEDTIRRGWIGFE